VTDSLTSQTRAIVPFTSIRFGTTSLDGEDMSFAARQALDHLAKRVVAETPTSTCRAGLFSTQHAAHLLPLPHCCAWLRHGPSRSIPFAGIHACSFKDLMLRPELVRAVVECGFELPSEVQHSCIPQAMLGLDILCQAKSGTGKTAVFVLSTLHQHTCETGVSVISAIVLCHARELAHQVAKEFERFSRYLPDVKTTAVFGGVPIAEHKRALKVECPTIVVGTPGRTLQLIREKSLDASAVRIFVVDECDQQLGKLDMRHDVQAIFQSTPRDKQTMLFSATLDDTMAATCRKFLHAPNEVRIDDAKLTLHGLQQHYVQLAEDDKVGRLNNLLDGLEFNQVVIFVRSVRRAIELDKLLRECSFPSVAMHAALRQEERLRLYESFKRFEHRILVCTDIWGRGIDIDRVNVCVNYDMPSSADAYLHRVGRAGRFGTKGLAITFVAGTDDSAVLESVQARFEVSITELPDHLDASTYMTA